MAGGLRQHAAARLTSHFTPSTKYDMSGISNSWV
jgi:hypothetical protein